MDREEIIKKLNRYAELLKQHFSLKKMILFGSYAKGTAKPHSDIDVAVIVQKNTMDFFQYAPLLWKLSGMVDSLIEPVLFEEETDDKSGLLEDISKNGIVIYE